MILTRTSGFIKEAGFTHSLTPARNCTFGCTYCYVPTMRIYGGLKKEDWEHWGQFTTFKPDAARQLRKELRPQQRIYCSPLVDPYQPAEVAQRGMPALLDMLHEFPPAVFVVQTRGPLVLRDMALLAKLSEVATVRVSFSVTTNREDVLRMYEPHCATFDERLAVIRHLRSEGISVFATLAPVLPCDPEALMEAVLDATANDIVCDPFHTRQTKKQGATTREAALKISEHHGFKQWHEPDFQAELVERMRTIAQRAGRRFGIGTEAFRWLSADQ